MDLTLLGGASWPSSAVGTWEIRAGCAVELLAPGRYRLTRLLRSQRGTEGATGNPAPHGTRMFTRTMGIGGLALAPVHEQATANARRLR